MNISETHLHTLTLDDAAPYVLHPRTTGGTSRPIFDRNALIAALAPGEQPDDDTTAEPYMTAAEAAHFLGVSPEVLRRRTCSGQIPYHRLLLPSFRYRRDELAAWVAVNTPPAPPPLPVDDPDFDLDAEADDV